MPKEQMNYAEARSVMVAESGKPEREVMQPPGPEFAIHWGGSSGGEYVQVGVQFDLATVEAYIAGVRRGSPSDVCGYLYSDNLRREDVQRSIRALKRARNSVFGADE